MSGLWLLSEANDDQGLTGLVQQYSVTVDPQPPLSGFFITLNGGEWFDDYVLVPNDATNLIISAIYEGTNGGGTGPIGIFLTNNPGPITTGDYGTNPVNPPGGFLSLSTNPPLSPPYPPGSPPLAGGTWYFGLYNDGTAPVTLFVEVQIQESLTPNLVQAYTNNNFTPLLTDAHTQSEICLTNFTNNQQVVAMQVGVRINDTNLDDLVLHLTSPQGTSVLLFENRGGTSATELGETFVSTNITNTVYTVFTEDTNLTTTPIKFAVPPFATNIVTPAMTLASANFETNIPGVYTNGALLDGWMVTNDVVTMESEGGTNLLTNYEVGIVTGSAGDPYYVTNIAIPGVATNYLGSNYLALTSGRIIQTFSNLVPGVTYQLQYYARGPGIHDWWPADGDAHDIIGTNNGTIPDTTNVSFDEGEVAQAFQFSGIPSTATTGNEVDFGTNAGNIGTNDFTVDFWIQQPSSATGLYAILGKRQTCDGSFNFWSVRDGTEFNDPSGPGVLHFEMNGNGPGVDYSILGATTAINDGNFHHVACSRQGLTDSIYIDGILNTNMVTSGIAPVSNVDKLIAGQSVCVGNPDGTLAFVGSLDELDLWGRALSPAEVFGVYHAGTLGKYSTNSVLPNFNLTFDGIATNNIILTNAAGPWQLFTNSFVPTNSEMTIEFQGNPLSVLLDDIQLIQLPATNYNNYFLPEEPLTPIVGEDPQGCWTLDVWDTRNDSASPTNGELLSWSLQLTTSSTNAVLDVLTNGVTITNTITNGTIAYYAVDVPDYVTFATNILTSISGGALTLFFNQTALPTGGLPGDVTLATGVTTTNTNTLATEGAPPPLLPGQRYFLGVENTGAPATFSLVVNFNGFTNIVTALTNAYGTNNTATVTNTYGTNAVIGTNNFGTNGPQYYSFVVPTNAVMVTFQILNLTTNGEVDLYAREGLPLPGPDSFDYASRNAGSNDQFIVITTNSVPVPLPVASTNNVLPLSPTVWYLAAYNFAQTNNIGYTITATVLTSNEISSSVIRLTNAVPYYTNATPGYPENLLFSFTVSNSPAGVQFSVTNTSGFGNVELLASLDNYPTPEETYFGSYNSGTATQLIQIVPNAMLPNLNGTWYLAVPNTTNTNVSYSITAITNVIAAFTVVPLTWSGAYDGYWDILTTSNWWKTGTTTPYPYEDNSSVTFDDTATGTTTISLRSALAPASVTVNSATKTYTFAGPGGVNGAPLTKNNSGTLIIDSTNNFSSVTFNGGTLQLGDNDANGSLATGSLLGAGTLTVPGTLVIDRSDNNLVSTVIAGGGGLTQEGTGTLTLSGVNTYHGTTSISGGTVVVDDTNALGSWTGGGVAINNGGTLDLSGLPAEGIGNPLFGVKQFAISGAGAGSNGVIVNNGNPLLGGIENIALSTNATIGGGARWDMRNPGGFAALNLGGATLTKSGANQISLASTTISAGNIVINQGILSIEVDPQFTGAIGGSAITVNAGGLLGENADVFGSFTRPIVLNGGGITNLTGGGASYVDAPISLTANSTLGNGVGFAIFDGVISGAFGLTNVGAGSNVFTNVNTYTGPTVVAQGTLVLTNNGSIADSSTITVDSGATLDASERTDQTLALADNQTLFANGMIGGNLTVDPGAVFSPGTAASQIGAVTVTGNVVLAGTNYMEINIQPAANDVITAPKVTYGGVLIVNNLDTVDSFTAGDSYTLYNTPASSGLFSSIVLPALPSGLIWSNTFGTNGPGTLSVVVASTNTTPQPVFSQFSIVGNGAITNIVFSGTNGEPGATYSLLTSTSLALPLSSWTVAATGTFDSLGNFSITNSPTNIPEFYVIQY